MAKAICKPKSVTQLQSQVFPLNPGNTPTCCGQLKSQLQFIFLTIITCGVLFIILNACLFSNQMEEMLFIGTVMPCTTYQNILKFILFIKISKQFKFHISVLSSKHSSIEISIGRQVAWVMKLLPTFYKNHRFRWIAWVAFKWIYCRRSILFVFVFRSLKLLVLPINLSKTLWGKKKNGQILAHIAHCFEEVYLFITHSFVFQQSFREWQSWERKGVGEDPKGCGIQCAGTLQLDQYCMTAVIPFCAI